MAGSIHAELVLYFSLLLLVTEKKIVCLGYPSAPAFVYVGYQQVLKAKLLKCAHTTNCVRGLCS
jgi:hypothetical protein